MRFAAIHLFRQMSNLLIFISVGHVLVLVLGCKATLIVKAMLIIIAILVNKTMLAFFYVLTFFVFVWNNQTLRIWVVPQKVSGFETKCIIYVHADRVVASVRVLHGWCVCQVGLSSIRRLTMMPTSMPTGGSTT